MGNKEFVFKFIFTLIVICLVFFALTLDNGEIRMEEQQQWNTQPTLRL